MRSIKGLVSYTLARDGRGGFSVTICKTKHGVHRSVETARNFLVKHVPDMNIFAMHISEGKVITHVK